MSNTQRDFSEVYSHRFEDLELDMSASVSRTVSEADILMFAGVSGDTNPVHLDQEFAASTMFGGRIAHGMLSAGLISAVFGTRLPGPGSIYLSQTLKFKAPVKPGDTVTITYTEAEMAELQDHAEKALEASGGMDFDLRVLTQDYDGNPVKTFDFAIALARNMGGSDYGSAERLFNISSSADGNYADGNYVQLPGTVTVHGS